MYVQKFFRGIYCEIQFLFEEKSASIFTEEHRCILHSGKIQSPYALRHALNGQMINVREVEIKSAAKDAGSRAERSRERGGGEKERRRTCELVEREIRLLRPHGIRVIGEV